MADYGLFFRSSSRSGDLPGRLHLRITHKGLSRKVVIPYIIHPQEWDADKQRFIIPRNDPERKRQLLDYQRIINSTLYHLNVSIRELKKHKRNNYTIDDILQHYQPVAPDNNTMLATYTDSLAVKLERHGKERTARGYRSAVLRLQSFNNGEEVDMKDITAEMINAFRAALQYEGLARNTVMFYTHTLRAIYRKAVKEGRVGWRKNPFEILDSEF